MVNLNSHFKTYVSKQCPILLPNFIQFFCIVRKILSLCVLTQTLEAHSPLFVMYGALGTEEVLRT